MLVRHADEFLGVVADQDDRLSASVCRAMQSLRPCYERSAIPVIVPDDRASTTLSPSADEGTEADFAGPRQGEQLQWVLRIAIRASTFAAVTGTQGTK